MPSSSWPQPAWDGDGNVPAIRHAPRRVKLAGMNWTDSAIDDAIFDGNLVIAPAWPAHPTWLAKFLAAIGTKIDWFFDKS